MTNNPPVTCELFDEMYRLVAASFGGDISPEERHRLDQLVCQDEETCDLYLKLVFESSILLTWAGHGEPKSIRKEELANPSPILPLLSTTLHGTFGYFSSGWPVAYLIATVIFGLGLLIGSVVHVSEPAQVARQSSVPSRVDAEPKMESVGRITGMVDCKWAGAALDSPAVPLGRKYELASGLLEITYDTGAKVILQGPVRYEVESGNGGYLAVGKLTARVEGGERIVDSKSPNLQVSKSPNSSLSTLHSPLFTVKTPTATVTDLGTEFGVEVANSGETTSHVFRGSVRVQVVAADGQTEGNARILRKNESIRVERSGGKQGDNRAVAFVSASTPSNFIREIPKRTIKTFDLADVVAGGDGFSGKRNRGIDPTSGDIVDSIRHPGRADKWPSSRMPGDGQYHRVVGIPLVDGVFIPDGSKSAVQVDSAGHVFDGFQGTQNATWQHIWVGPKMFGMPYSAKAGEVDYASPEHGFLMLGSSKAITFDLEAIRRANRGCKLLRLRTVVANAETEECFRGSLADAWVLVDGKCRYQRWRFTNAQGCAPIMVPIYDTDRFLTLASTDGGDGVSGDDIIFGDPHLELMSVDANVQPAVYGR